MYEVNKFVFILEPGAESLLKGSITSVVKGNTNVV